MKLFDRRCGFVVSRHFNESKTFRTSGVTVFDYLS